MGEDPSGAEALRGALAELPVDVARTIDVVASREDPDLAARLRATAEPSMRDRSLVERLLSDEFVLQVGGPEWEPTDYGLAVERAVVQFLMRFPMEETTR